MLKKKYYDTFKVDLFDMDGERIFTAKEKPKKLKSVLENFIRKLE